MKENLIYNEKQDEEKEILGNHSADDCDECDDEYGDSHDGVDNEEHILDIEKQIEMLIENIKDNTDTAFDILKLHQEDKEQDIVDVYRINCSQILDCEKLAQKTYKKYNNLKDKLNAGYTTDKKDAVKKQIEKLINFYKEIETYEKESVELLNSLIKKSK